MNNSFITSVKFRNEIYKVKFINTGELFRVYFKTNDGDFEEVAKHSYPKFKCSILFRLGHFKHFKNYLLNCSTFFNDFYSSESQLLNR